MNSHEIINVLNYLNSAGLITSKEIEHIVINCPTSHPAFILFIAQILKRKSALQLQTLTDDLYTHYVTSDNTRIVHVFKHLITIYLRSQRSTKAHYYLKWLAYANKPEDRISEHFGFMIARENPHERLFNYYKNKELVLNRLENMYSSYEAEKCPFTPTINHYSSIIAKYFPVSSRTNCKYRSLSEERDLNSQRNNKPCLSSTNANTNIYYTSLFSNKSNTIDNNQHSKRQSSISPRSIKLQTNKVSNKHKGHSKCSDSDNAEMKYVMDYLTNQSATSLFPSFRHHQYRYQHKNKSSSYVNLLSNRETKSPNETSRGNRHLFRGNKRGETSKTSKYLSESNCCLSNPKQNNKENQFENVNSTNVYDKITSLLSQENQTNPKSTADMNCTSKGQQEKKKPIDKSTAFFYTFKTNSKGNYSQYKHLKKNSPSCITKQCKSAHIFLDKSSKEYFSKEDFKDKEELSAKQQNLSQKRSNAIEKQLNDNGSKVTADTLKSNTLQVSSGVVNKSFFDKQKSFKTISNNYSTIPCNHQITLQSISDSKLYEIANHYITTDESFERNKCLSNTNRKLTKNKPC